MPRPITSIRDVAVAVRGRRQELGLSQAEVARRARVSRQWVSEFESGKPAAELSLVIRLLDALELNLTIEDERSSLSPGPTSQQQVDLDDLLDRYRER